MPLRGELSSVDLAHIFQMLILNQKAGTLKIQHERVTRSLFFTQEGVLVPFERDHLVERAAFALLRSGRLSDVDVDKARCNMGALKKDLLETLVHMNVLQPDERLQAMREQLEEDVYELFFLTDASFEFEDGQEPEGGEIDPALALSPNGLIMEAARRTDEWQYIESVVQSSADVVEPVHELEALDPADVTAEARTVYAGIDGVRTVEEIVECTGLPRFVVFRVTAMLLDKGVARSVPAEDLFERGRQLLDAGRAASAVHLFERAIERGLASVELLSGAGSAREAAGEPMQAAEHYLAAGRRAEEEGAHETALQLYLRVRDVLPTHVAARERLFALRKVAQACLEPGAFDAMAEGIELATILYELGRRDELVHVLSGLVEEAGTDPGSIERVAELAANLGASSLAVNAMLRASDRRAHRKEFDSAIRCLKRAQSVDPSRGELSERIHVYTARARSRRARRRSVVRSFAMVVAFVVLFLAYGRYSSAAMSAYAKRSMEDFVQTSDFADGRSFYGGICKRFPLTIPFLLSLENLRALEVAELNHVEIERYRSRVHGEAEQSRLEQARIFKEAALNARHTGDFARALDLLRKAKDLVGDQDHLDLASAMVDLEKYLADATRLRSEAAFYRNAGRFEEAHARLSRLIAQFPNSPEAKNVTLPVRVTSDPPRARIAIDGTPLRFGGGASGLAAETPFVIDLPMDRAVDICLTLDGYVPRTGSIQGAAAPLFHFELAARPPLETILPRPIMLPPVSDGSLALVPLRGGHLAALKGKSLDVAWMVELRELAEVTAPPAFTPRGLLVPVTLDALLLLDPKDGRALATIALPGKPSSTPVVSGERIVVRIGEGSLAAGTFDGPFELLPVPARVVAGPVALDGGDVAFGCDDGRVRLLAPDRSMTALVSPTPPRGGFFALESAGSLLFAGDRTGTLHVFDASAGASVQHVASIAALADEPIEVISPDVRRPVVGGRGRVVAIDLQARTARVLAEGGANLARGRGPWIAVALPGGTLRVFDRADLAPAGTFALEADVDLAPWIGDGVAIAATSAGRVAGILCQRR